MAGPVDTFSEATEASTATPAGQPHRPLSQPLHDAQSSLLQPVSPREPLALVLMVALADVCLFHQLGYAGWGVLFAGLPVLLLFGSTAAYLPTGARLTRGKRFAATAAMVMLLLLVTARLVWQGDPFVVAAGMVLLAACSLAVVGLVPFVLDALFQTGTVALSGGVRWLEYLLTARHLPFTRLRLPSRSVVVPLAAVVLFAAIFIKANPDLADWVSVQWEALMRWPRQWWELLAVDVQRLVFWGFIALIAAGLFVPGALRNSLLVSLMLPESSPPLPAASPAAPPATPRPTPSYLAYRNTLVAVSLLFAAYLVYEFQSLWFREFPPGFYYAGYAHEGAAWLTVALAVATLMLSVIFHGSTLHDPRLPRLKLLAKIWSLLNFLLAVAVVHRMQIYINFNGMTRMRVVGLLGIATVVAGFCLVLIKIAKNRGFTWLIQRQLWALASAVLLYLLTPVDMLIHSYNVRQILAGDLAPSVQISAHSITAEGVLVLLPLTECQDPIIREGIRAMLAEWGVREELAAEQLANASKPRFAWTRFQGADHLLHQQLQQHRDTWESYRNESQRTQARERFDTYAYQWY